MENEGSWEATQVVEDAELCVFGSHASKPHRCSFMILNSNREEKVIAETDYHHFGAMTYLNSEFIFYFYGALISHRQRSHCKVFVH